MTIWVTSQNLQHRCKTINHWL